MAIVLGSAGRVMVWQAWVYGGLSLALNVAQRLLLAANPELAQERAKPGAGAQSWDKALLGVGLLLTLATLVAAGLELRLEEGPRLAIAHFGVGVTLQLAGAAMFLWALRENRFFSAVVRLQTDRGHTVCTTGP